MKLMIVGATGLIGRHCLEQALADDYFKEIYVWARSASGYKHHKLQEYIIDFEKLRQTPDSFRLPFENEGVMVCCVGTTMAKVRDRKQFEAVDYSIPVALGRLVKRYQLSQFLVISSIGANTHSPFFYSRVKGKMEQQLTHLNLKGLTIVRPALLLGERINDKRIGEKIAQKIGMFLLHYLPFIIPKNLRPIQAKVVAAFLLDKAKQANPGYKLYYSGQLSG